MLARFKPSNPIDADRLQQIGEISAEVLEVFAKQYLIAFKDVMIEESIAADEKKRAKEAKKEEKDNEEKDGGSGLPHVKKRTREPIEPEIHEDVGIKIVATETIDDDIDPYVVYIVKSNIGDDEAIVNRRFKQFRQLHKQIGKKVKGAKLPDASSKFGKRNLDHEFVKSRKKTLNKYLKELSKDKNTKKSKEFQTWLGLGKEVDPTFQETYDRALKRSKWELWIWRNIENGIETEAEGIAKLIIEEIRRRMFHQILADLPPEPRIRKASMQLAYKTIVATVNPAVDAGWKKVSEQVAGIKDEVKKVVSEALGKVLEVKNDIKGKIKEAMAAAMNPIMEVLIPLLQQLLGAVKIPLVAVLKPAIENRANFYEKWRDVLLADKWDNDKFEECEKEVMEVRNDLKKKAEDKIKEAIGAVIGDLKDKFSLDAVAGVFSPLESVYEIFNSIFDIVNPANQKEFIRELMEYKEKILKEGPGEKEKVEELLDQEERYCMWKRWWCCYRTRREGYDIYWELSHLLPDLGSVTNLFYDFIWDLERVNRKVLKKFSWKFGDHLSSAVAKGIDGDYREVVDQCMIIAFDKAIYLGKKLLGGVGQKFLKNFFLQSVLGDVNKEVVPAIEGALEPLESLIIAPADQLLSITAMVTESLTEVIEDNVDTVVQTISDEIVGDFGGVAAPRERSVPNVIPVADDKKDSSSSSSSSSSDDDKEEKSEEKKDEPQEQGEAEEETREIKIDEPKEEIKEEIKEEPKEEIKEEPKEKESSSSSSSDSKEEKEPAEEIKEQIKEEPIEEIKEEIKEEPKEEIKEEPKEEVKEEEPKEEIKEEPKEKESSSSSSSDSKEEKEPAEEIKEEEPKEEIKEAPIEEIKEEIKEEPKEEIKEEEPGEVIEEIKEEEPKEEIKEAPIEEIKEEVKEEEPKEKSKESKSSSSSSSSDSNELEPDTSLL